MIQYLMLFQRGCTVMIETATGTHMLNRKWHTSKDLVALYSQSNKVWVV